MLFGFVTGFFHLPVFDDGNKLCLHPFESIQSHRADTVDHPEPGDTAEQQPALTVVTNAVNIAAELTVRHQIKIVVTGGVARPQSYELTGPFAEEVLKEVNIDIAFLGVEAIDSIIGAAASHEDEARVNRQIAARARKIVVVTDSSKFKKSAFASMTVR